MLLALFALAAGWSPTTARADGDPASDVLATQPLFLPQDAVVSPVQQAELVALLREARESGFQIRLAIIASANDLGSVTELWSQPQDYARFLGQELSLVYKGPLLVIMPAGFGFYGFDRPPAAREPALAELHPSDSGSLGSVAISAIRRLALRAGHTLAISHAVASSSPRSSSAAIDAWVAFAIGCALIAIAWAASLRARPLQLTITSVGRAVKARKSED